MLPRRGRVVGEGARWMKLFRRSGRHDEVSDRMCRKDEKSKRETS